MLVEEYVAGTPITVGLLELPGGSVVVFPPLATEATEADFYDADTKLDVDSRNTVTVRAAELAPDVLDKLTEHARTLWDGLGLRGSARIDFILTEDGEPAAVWSPVVSCDRPAAYGPVRRRWGTDQASH